MSRKNFEARWVSALVLLALFAPLPASAWVSVGVAPTCEARTVQAAINTVMARQRAGDFADPRIVIAAGSFNEALIIDGRDINGHVVSISGGYAADCSGPQAGAVSTINALHRSGSVLTVRGATTVTLDSLTFTGANTTGNGGGIYFDGSGQLDATRVRLFNNRAGRGGGLFANGTAAGLVVRLHAQTTVQSNFALHSGGGIRAQGKTRLYMLEGNQVLFNWVGEDGADGAGGGLQVIGPAQADIGSGWIFANLARHGGGISAESDAGHNGSSVRFFATTANRPTHIDNNIATLGGGGIFVGAGGNVACGMGSISRNRAPDGAAIDVEQASGAVLTDAPLSLCGVESTTSPAPIGCAEGGPCSSVDDNRAVSVDDPYTATTGAVVSTRTDSQFSARRVEMRRNLSGNLFHGPSAFAGHSYEFENCLLVDNHATGDFMRTEESGWLSLKYCTIAGNQIDGANVLALAGDLSLRQSLLWQVGKVSLAQSGSHARRVDDVIAYEIQSLGGGSGDNASVVALPPRFADPSAGDYHLQWNTPGLDFAADRFDDVATDIDGHTRVVDLPIADRPGGGPVDLGAYETKSSSFPVDDTFDEVTAPALPFGWVDVHADNHAGWITRAAGSGLSAPNSAFTDDPPLVTDRALESPPVHIVAKGRLRFFHKFDLEDLIGGTYARDGVVLEIAIGGAAFVDIFQAGGSVVSGGYTRTIPFFAPGNNPLPGRAVWSGSTQGSYRKEVIDLPASANGRSVRLRWRMGTDDANAAAHSGYSLDDVHVDVNGAVP